MSTFSLNTKSGFLHKENHGGDSNTILFGRADAADLEAQKLGLKLAFCKVCFVDNRNTLEATRMSALEERMISGETVVGESVSAPERVRPETLPTSVHSDASVPAGLPNRPVPRRLPRMNQMDQSE